MNTREAEQAGVQAYREGKPAAAVFNRRFCDAAHKAGHVAKLFSAYYWGWHKAKFGKAK